MKPSTTGMMKTASTSVHTDTVRSPLGATLGTSLRTACKAIAVAAVALLAACERPQMDASTQWGYRGTAMGQVTNPRIVGPIAEAQVPPAPVPAIPSPEGSPKAKDVHKNVQVLGDLPAGEFTRTMLAITAWVSPKQGCTYCHATGEELSSDKLYTKVVARKMLQMTRHLNTDWQQHVGNTGVTCYTCHRGEPVPAKLWFIDKGQRHAGGTTPYADGQNHPSTAAGLTSLGLDPLKPYLLGNAPIRAAGPTALPTAYRPSEGAGIRQTENTFGLMVHMSKSLGVNCTFCHNTRSFDSWAQSPMQRTTAFHGIQMARDLNNAYMVPLTSTFPKERLGPMGDVAKVNCATCHQGLNKPLGGALMMQDHAQALGGLMKVMATQAATAAAAPASATSTGAGPLGLLLFAVGKSDIGDEAGKALAQAVATLKAQPEMKVAISGFADKTGNADKNLELAKQRAMAVRDALKAAGVADDRVALKKPEFAVGGTEADARRVEINPVP